MEQLNKTKELLSLKIGHYLRDNKLILATAESCTAGLIAATIAETSGSSQWLDAGFVVYTPEAKEQSLGVSIDTINDYNITSTNVAKEMSIGAIKNSRANIALAVTGVAGPSGGTDEIPVGTVCMSWAFLYNSNIVTFEEKMLFHGNRNEIRVQVVNHMLEHIPYYNEMKLSLTNSSKQKNKIKQ